MRTRIGYFEQLLFYCLLTVIDCEYSGRLFNYCVHVYVYKHIYIILVRMFICTFIGLCLCCNMCC